MSNNYLGSIKCCLISFILFIGFSVNESFAIDLNHITQLNLSSITDTQSSGDDDSSSDDSSSDDNSSDDSSSDDAVCPAGTYPVYSSDDDSSSGDDDSSSDDDKSSSDDDDSSSSNDDSSSSDDNSSSGDDDSSSDDDDSKEHKDNRSYECVAIEPDCTRKTISIGNNIQKSEPNQGSKNYNFTLNLDSPIGQDDCPVEIMYETQDGGMGYDTALQGLDYEARSGTVNFVLGESSKTVSVPVLADTDNDEEVEAFTITITKSEGADIIKASALGLINFEF